MCHDKNWLSACQRLQTVFSPLTILYVLRPSWCPAVTAVRSSVRRGRRMAPTNRVTEEMTRRTLWWNTCGRWSWIWHRLNCSWWRPSAKSRYVGNGQGTIPICHLVLGETIYGSSYYTFFCNTICLVCEVYYFTWLFLKRTCYDMQRFLSSFAFMAERWAAFGRKSFATS